MSVVDRPIDPSIETVGVGMSFGSRRLSGLVRIGPRSGRVCGGVSVLAIPSVDFLFSASLASEVLLVGPSGPGEWQFDQNAAKNRFAPVRIVPGNVDHEGPSRTTLDLKDGGILFEARVSTGECVGRAMPPGRRRAARRRRAGDRDFY
jgi:hypothetical protein